MPSLRDHYRLPLTPPCLPWWHLGKLPTTCLLLTGRSLYPAPHPPEILLTLLFLPKPSFSSVSRYLGRTCRELFYQPLRALNEQHSEEPPKPIGPDQISEIERLRWHRTERNTLIKFSFCCRSSHLCTPFPSQHPPAPLFLHSLMVKHDEGRGAWRERR